MWLALVLLTVTGAAAWMLRRPARRAPDPDARDADALAAAEREVRDLPSMTPPDAADDALPDWGPGAPRR